MSIVHPSPLFPDQPALRRCKTCGESKPLDAFAPRSEHPGNRRGICRACKAARYRALHPLARPYAPLKKRTADEPWPCAICGVPKMPQAFRKRKDRPFGVDYICLSCDRTRHKAWKERTGYKRPPLTEAQKEHERWMQRKRAYGLTKAEVLALVAGQKECCALCLRPLRLDGKRGYFVDHCHTPGRIRGILCPLCNGFLARIGDDEAGARRLLAYVIGSPPGNPPVTP